MAKRIIGGRGKITNGKIFNRHGVVVSPQNGKTLFETGKRSSGETVVVDNWILATGVWRDEGIWEDNKVWID